MSKKTKMKSPMTAKAPKPSKPNPFRIEYEDNGAEHHPTLVVFTRRAADGDLERVLEKHPRFAVGARALDTAGCVFSCRVLEPEITEAPVRDAIGGAGKAPDVKPPDPDLAMAESLKVPGKDFRINVSLSMADYAKVLKVAREEGLLPGQVARRLMLRGLQ